MASPRSGSNEELELVKIETEDLSLTIKGKPYHDKYESLKEYETFPSEEIMHFHVSGAFQSVKVYDVRAKELVDWSEHPPIFFEHRNYQLVVVNKGEKELSFYHEYPALQKAVTLTQMGPIKVLMGNLCFPNEVGLTNFEIRDQDTPLLSVTMEIFPSKLDYKNDYRLLLDEVSEEIYNLAFHLLKRTFLGASSVQAKNPTRSEFYRILQDSFERFMKAITHIKRQPHHVLFTKHQLVRGEKIQRLDSIGLQYLRKRPYLIQRSGEKLIPTKGITGRKEVSFDTLENRFIKWMMMRITHKIDDLLKALKRSEENQRLNIGSDIITSVNRMKATLNNELNDPFWGGIGKA